MTFTGPMLASYPADMPLDKPQLARVIDAVESCAQACTACADACLSEPPDRMPQLTECIRDNLDCADICAATSKVLSRHTGHQVTITWAQAQAALAATEAAERSCGTHRDMHDHCRVCEQACRQAAAALRIIVEQLAPRQSGVRMPAQGVDV